MKSDKEQWQELFAYVEKEILDYDDNQKLQKNAVLRLRGLSQGQVVANNNCQKHGSYSPEVLLVAFRINKNKIKSAIQSKEFNSEENKIAYINAIVRGNLNDVYERMQRVKKEKESVKKVDTSIMDNRGIKYKEKTNSNIINKHEDLW